MAFTVLHFSRWCIERGVSGFISEVNTLGGLLWGICKLPVLRLPKFLFEVKQLINFILLRVRCNFNESKHSIQIKWDITSLVSIRTAKPLGPLKQDFYPAQYLNSDISSKPTRSIHIHTPRPFFAFAQREVPNHTTLSTKSIPFSSAPGYLNVHMPSRVTSQYAPDAVCIPRRPDDSTGSFAPSSWLLGRDCWMMVQVTLKRYCVDGEDSGFSGEVDVAEMRDWRIVFCRRRL